MQLIKQSPNDISFDGYKIFAMQQKGLGFFVTNSKKIYTFFGQLHYSVSHTLRTKNPNDQQLKNIQNDYLMAGRLFLVPGNPVLTFY